MILNDEQIKELCEAVDPMITPFEPTSRGKPSWGLGSFGYDMRLGPHYMTQVDYPTLGVMDPLKDNSRFWEGDVQYEKITIKPHSIILTETVETFNMPEHVTGVVWGKSTYARLGILVNVTPLEAGWRGKLTIEIANLGCAPVVLHVGQGIAQVVFFRGHLPTRTYANRESGGIYQNQTGVTLPK